MENDVLRAWLLIHELSDQLAHNHKLAATLHSQASAAHQQALLATSGCALRRFNIDISKEVFDSELERLNAQFIIDNQSLCQENRHFSLLLKEYENTMQTIMSKFRNHALAAQQHELTLTRHYEALLLAADSQSHHADPTSDTKAIQRLARTLRALHRSMAGEEVDDAAHDSPVDIPALLHTLDGPFARDDWALERETEITRLEKENDELRRMLGIDSASLSAKGITLDRGESARYSTSLSLSLEARKRSGSSAAPWAFDASVPRERDSSAWNGWESQPQPPPPPPPPQPPQPQRQPIQHRLQSQLQPPHGSAARVQEPLYSKPLRRPANLFTPNPGPAPPVTVGSTVDWSQSTPSKLRLDRWTPSNIVDYSHGAALYP